MMLLILQVTPSSSLDYKEITSNTGTQKKAAPKGRQWFDVEVRKRCNTTTYLPRFNGLSFPSLVGCRVRLHATLVLRRQTIPIRRIHKPPVAAAGESQAWTGCSSF